MLMEFVFKLDQGYQCVNELRKLNAEPKPFCEKPGQGFPRADINWQRNSGPNYPVHNDETANKNNYQPVLGRRRAIFFPAEAANWNFHYKNYSQRKINKF